MKQKIVLTGGKFNKIHPGHLWLLAKAKKLGYLIVVLAHDTRNKRAYAIPVKKRKKMIEKLGLADKVVIGHKEKFVKVVHRFRPSIIVLGYDQKLPDKETKQIVKKRKIRVVKFRKYGKYNTRNLA
jgi:cytidyltransferase-like protein